MDHRKIEYFIKTVETGSFSKAAELCFISQTAVSKQIAVLEAEIGVILFDRNGYRPVLTEAGRVFYEDCKRIVTLYHQAVEKAKQAEAGGRRQLRLGISGPGESKILPAVFREFKKIGNDVDLVIREHSFSELLLALQNRQLDVVFGLGSMLERLPHIDYHRLYPHSMCVIVASEHPWNSRTSIEGKELKDEGMILFSQTFSGVLYDHILTNCRLDGFEPHVVAVADSYEEILLLVSSGKGVAIMADEVLHNTTGIHSIPLVDPYHKDDYGIAKLKGKHNLIADVFIDTVERYFSGERPF